MRAARTIGGKLARNATVISTAGGSEKLTTSWLDTPYSSDSIQRANTQAAASPSDVPNATCHKLDAITNHPALVGLAPSASRIPISRVRRSTPWLTTP